MTPSDPSEPAPDSTTAAALRPWADASVRKNRSIATRWPRAWSGSLSVRWPSAIERCFAGEITYTVVGWTGTGVSTSRTDMCVTCCNTAGSWLSYSGDRCRMTT
ncbi:MAG TPA: hypothetical protein VFS21_37715 [Roseiflexaceae bacterium]|nr:hypothetical protein [Roseiflexaceae bacterium]